jgi:hypothetical protein
MFLATDPVESFSQYWGRTPNNRAWSYLGAAVASVMQIALAV